MAAGGSQSTPRVEPSESTPLLAEEIETTQERVETPQSSPQQTNASPRELLRSVLYIGNWFQLVVCIINTVLFIVFNVLLPLAPHFSTPWVYHSSGAMEILVVPPLT
jgi:hypothetical protein